MASALGEFFERLSCTYFWTHYYLGETFAQRSFTHYPRIAAGIEGLRQTGFSEPGFDLDEIATSPNIEIHFINSSGIISWNFLGGTPDCICRTSTTKSAPIGSTRSMILTSRISARWRR